MEGCLRSHKSQYFDTRVNTVTTYAAQAINAQAALNAEVVGLVVVMDDANIFLADYKSMADLTPPFEKLVNATLKQNMECSIFIRDYCRVGFLGKYAIHKGVIDLTMLQNMLRLNHSKRAPQEKSVGSRAHTQSYNRFAWKESPHRVLSSRIGCLRRRRIYVSRCRQV